MSKSIIEMSKNPNKLFVKGDLHVEVIKNEDDYTAYSSALNLFSYGDSPDDAVNSLKEAIDLFFDCLKTSDNITEVLNELGWEVETKDYKTYAIPPVVIRVEDIKLDKEITPQHKPALHA